MCLIDETENGILLLFAGNRLFSRRLYDITETGRAALTMFFGVLWTSFSINYAFPIRIRGQ